MGLEDSLLVREALAASFLDVAPSRVHNGEVLP